ncbi:MAG: cysteine desulfurase [Proteobacteria bacterium]|nr:cysteine desulfurase [Pseudomonadota bacterium]
MTPAVYLDYNATTPVRPEAAAAVADALALTGNASSVHRFGRLARRKLEDAREAVAALVGAPAERVVFTSGGTEANNLALTGAGCARRLVSAGEHDSVLNAAAGAEGGAERIPLRRDGVVDLDALEARLGEDSRPALVSVMLANNETGVIQPVARAAETAHGRGALVHCDAVQGAGKIPVDMAALGVDLLSLSAHKLGGPQGVGALIVAEGIALAPLMLGGGQERRHRAGTENLPGIAGFGAAAECALAGLERMAGLAELRDRLERRLRARAPEIKIYGAGAPRLSNTSCFGVPGLAAETQVMALDLAGIAVSAGAACSSGKVAPSHVLGAMGASEAEAGSAIRISLGWDSGAPDIERFLEAWSALYSRIARGTSARGTPAANPAA